MKNFYSITLTTISVLVGSLIQAQNLASNPSFENYTNTFCGIQGTADFNQIMEDWVNPTNGSPQVFFTNIANTCYNFQPNSQYSGPIGIKGSQLPKTGNVMLGLWSYTFPGNNQRQYAQIQLTSPMTAGNTYVVEFYASLADSMELAIDKLGALLTTTAPSSTTDQVLNYTPQVYATSPVDEVSNWVLISDTIIAQDNYEFLTIGNFFDDNSTNSVANPFTSGGISTYGAFYFIDDVNVEEVGVANISEITQNKIAIYPTYVSDYLTIDSEKESVVKIYDVQGQLVYSNEAVSGQTKINVSGFAKGVYKVTVQNGNTSSTQKIIK